MGKALLLLSVTPFIFLSLLSQNIIYKGSQPYPATSSWDFNAEAHHMSPYLEVQVAKTSSGGYLKLAIEVGFDALYIGGTVSIILDDGSMITCTDKGIRDFVDRKSVVLYSFTKDEIARLMKTNIQTIRFNIKSSEPYGTTEAYTAKNLGPFTFSERKGYDTAGEISLLFK